MLGDPLFLAHDGFGNDVVPGVSQHEGNDMRQHASILDEIQTFVEDLVFSLDVEQPSEGIPVLEVVPSASLRVSLLEFQFLNSLLELFVKGDQEGDLLDEVVEFS